MTMKPLSAVLHEIATVPTVETITQQQRPLTDRDSKMVATLFEQLKAVFPAWKQAFPTDDHQRRALAEWTRALVDAGCTSREQLQLGMRMARSHGGDFFPSTSKFIKWCEVTPESLGLPTLDSALVEVRTRRYTHPAVELAAKATSWERQTLSADAYRAVFDQAYAQLVRRMMAGEDLNAEVMKGLPTRAQIQHSPEFYQQAGQRAVANLKKLFKRGGEHGGQ
ncbi:replication protein P [Aeromonas caviae]|uniref:replication protein P n=1 Tax=Aeromonas caviae TaxID=648 RepID=UPI00214EA532|nr:replication protein P [Aeromonas caviae]MCR3931246.1 replication protein P [Aeromonas caviae]MCU7792523.1 replication protein P [Aeromonas caviae]MDX7704756.1 replication protein P [Aeromonas caviae]MDX7793228.1 replication protein P [Aeromonas caviae]WEE21051.1 replication protein P [Aeromonas caviae]